MLPCAELPSLDGAPEGIIALAYAQGGFLDGHSKILSVNSLASSCSAPVELGFPGPEGGAGILRL